MKFSDPVKYVEFLNDLMLQKNASDMYLTYNEPPALRIMEEVYRQDELENLMMISSIRLHLHWWIRQAWSILKKMEVWTSE